jgi:hypothetical protein
MNAHGSMYITGGSTNFNARATGRKVTGWSANAVSRHGRNDVEIDTANSRLTANTPGQYIVSAQLTGELDDLSGTSGDAAGQVGIALAKNGTIVTGTKALMNHTAVDLPQSLSICNWPLELAIDDYVELMVIAVDASGNDVTVKEAQLSMVKVN